MERRHWEDAKATHDQFGGTWSKTEEAFGIGRFAALQTGQIAAAAEEVYVETLQVLLP